MVKIHYKANKKIVKIHNSYYISIPKNIVKDLRIGEGDELLMFLTDDKRIVLSPATKVDDDL